MIEIKGYRVVSKIEENTNSVVYRAIGLEDDIAVIIKLLRDEYPTQNSITRYKQEYEITSRINLQGTIHGGTTINRGCQDLSHFYVFVVWHCYCA
ncbi:MAG: hypothetical protein SFH39_09685 [Candidatus Magnetobacterium sp. LHC-1]|nr:hypothetical protein [Nitrospirota bacterium]